ncbi:hypothetical protein GALL_246870 [mine drainage metagenome]|uniref:Uncharacterized protein n=1 Tax=mine drainage metagenome TaxID=410659 RepID=A0A1J5RZ41_9ZZZZ
MEPQSVGTGPDLSEPDRHIEQGRERNRALIHRSVRQRRTDNRTRSRQSLNRPTGSTGNSRILVRTDTDAGQHPSQIGAGQSCCRLDLHLVNGSERVPR